MTFLGIIILTKKGVETVNREEEALRCNEVRQLIRDGGNTVEGCNFLYRDGFTRAEDTINRIYVSEAHGGVYMLDTDYDLSEIDGECLRRALINLELRGYVREFHLSHCLSTC